jgi:peptidyl-prolyl cis-trans isomerase SurA
MCIGAGLLSAASVMAQAPNLEEMDLVMRSVPDGPVASVYGEPISRGEFMDLYRSELVRLRQGRGVEVNDVVRIEVARQAIKMLLEHEILYQKAKEAGLSVSDAQAEEAWRQELDRLQKVFEQTKQEQLSEEELLERAGATREEALRELKEALLVEKMRAKLLEDAGVEVSDDEVETLYEDVRNNLGGQGTAHVQTIYLPVNSPDEVEEARKKAKRALMLVSAGQSFTSVASEISEGPFREQGGDWGVRELGVLPENLRKLIEEMEPGEVSEIRETPQSVYVVKLIDKTTGEEPSLDDVRAGLRRTLLAEKAAGVVQEYCRGVVDRDEDVMVYLDLSFSKELRARPELREFYEELAGVGEAAGDAGG